MHKVLICDDHAVVRQGLKQILLEDSNKFSCEEASNGREVLDMIAENKWDAVVLDISLPGMSGIEILKEIKKVRPKLPVLVLTVHSEEQFGLRTLKAGAAGYLTKDSAPEELVNALKRIMNGGKYINQQIVEILMNDVDNNSDRPPHENLSNREFEIMRLIASGKAPMQIADELALSVKTVSTYRSRLLEKMKFTTNAEITHYAITNKLV
ncbi:MAG: DNA-binding response regulator [Ignavibacteriales bacterium]|nr:MAG: DNA-binding response regulator [Ignavibacteriales bacterium]